MQMHNSDFVLVCSIRAECLGGVLEQILVDFKFLERIRDLAEEWLVEAGFDKAFTELLAANGLIVHHSQRTCM